MIKRKSKTLKRNPANFDNETGIGRSKYHSSNQYDSVEVLMKPSIFLKLAFRLSYADQYPEGFEFIIDHIDSNLPIATPYLMIIQLVNSKYMIEGHQGRHRNMVIKNKFGDKPSKVLLIFENFKINNKILNEINEGVMSENNKFIEGPLFEY
jgi:hypothetical protein